MNLSVKNKKSILTVLILLPLVISLIFMGIGLNRPISAATFDGEITIMTYNIHFGVGMDDKVDLERLAQNILLENPDIVGLQEVENGRIISQGVDMALWLALRLGMYYRFYPAVNDAAFGVAILSKFPIVETNRYDLTSIQLERVLLHCKLQINATFVLDVFVTHLGLSNENQSRQVQEILAFTDLITGPKILMGDFNMNDTNPIINTDIYNKFNDTWRIMNPISNEGSFPSYPGPELGNRIDYIFATGYSDIIKSEIITSMIDGIHEPWEFGSDHLPVVSILKY